jgi:hypothetical protein
MKARFGHCSHVASRREPDAENSREATPDFGDEELFATFDVGAIVDGFDMLMTSGVDGDVVTRFNGRKPRLWVFASQFGGSRHKTVPEVSFAVRCTVATSFHSRLLKMYS